MIRRMKSEVNLDRSAKENRNSSNQQHIKTDFTSHLSANLSSCNARHSPYKKDKKLKTIKFSLAHIEYKKKADTNKLSIYYLQD